jgi:replicative DNA helicase
MSRDDSIFHVERLLLQTAMARPSSLQEVNLQPKHFASEHHASLWEIIQGLSLDGKPTDPVSISDEACRAGRLNLSQMALAIASASELYTSSDASHQAGILLGAWRDREARAIASDLLDGSTRREEGAVDRAIAALMEIHAEDRSYEHTAQTAMQAALEQASEARRNGGRLLGVPTGIFDLDEALGGLHDGDLVVVGAPPGAGKTGLLLGMTTAGAKTGDVGLVSGEQPFDQVGLRWLAAGTNVSVGRLRAGKFNGEDMMLMDDAAERYGALPIRILDRGSPDITEVIRIARRWKHQYDIRALYVDYLQRLEMASLSKAPKHERVGAIARCLKNLARDLRIPVIALAQVRRPADGKENPRLQMHHLADSSEIEKEADQIMMLWRDMSNPQAVRAPAEINLVKNRHGNIGPVYCTWHGGSTSFLNRTPDDEFQEAA